ncbi:class I adenylate-forming enzyme family protein [Streptomyces sp. bgisy027]|uniref:class I adenylate-forming enzyme family protein n=1 Tax=unclassified Streptomyces TaxID=2593676 RepID=UPI003D70585B
MSIGMLLEQAVRDAPNREVFGLAGPTLSLSDLWRRALTGAAMVDKAGPGPVVFIGPGGPAFAVALFASAFAGRPLLPLDHRLGAPWLRNVLRKAGPGLVIADGAARGARLLSEPGVLASTDWLAATSALPPRAAGPVLADPHAAALLICGDDGGTVPLSHADLCRPVLDASDFALADPGEVSLMCLEPYRFTGLIGLLGSLCAGRRLVRLRGFSPEAWLTAVAGWGVTHALVAPTMLGRIVEHWEMYGSDRRAAAPRVIVYDGEPLPPSLLERALRLFPETDFVRTYTPYPAHPVVAVLDPETHRVGGERIGSIGRPRPGVDIEVRDSRGRSCPPRETGELWVSRSGAVGASATGWCRLHERAWRDGAGYVFLGDWVDTPASRDQDASDAEIEALLRRHPDIADVAVTSMPDARQKRRVTASVVARPGRALDVLGLRLWVSAWLRSPGIPAFVVTEARGTSLTNNVHCG